MPTLSLSVFNLGSLGMVGVTRLFVVSKGMASLILGPIIISLGVQLPPFFCGRVFGKLRSPKRVTFFVWTAVHGQILTLDNLMLRGRILVTRYCMCHWNEEIVDHLLLHCLIAQCFRSLGLNGSCQALWKAWYIFGAFGWEILIQTFGIWFLAVWFGLFGRKEIGALLRISRNPWFNYKLYAKRLYLIGLGVGASRIVSLSWSLFRLLVLHFKFILVVCLFVAFLCVHHHEHLIFAFFYFSVWLIKFLLLIKKEEEIKYPVKKFE